MATTGKTFTAAFTALVIGGLMINPASAAQEKPFGDLSAITHNGAAASNAGAQQAGRLPDFYKWSDKGYRSQARVGSELKPIGQYSPKSYKWSDIESVTHN